MDDFERKLNDIKNRVLKQNRSEQADSSFLVYDENSNSQMEVSVDLSSLESDDIEFFFDEQVRKIWHKQEEEWYFSIVDVCQVLTDSADGRKYWNKLKQRLKNEGNETVTNCHQLKMKAADGKMRKTDCASTEQLLRIIQSIPSKKAEPFKVWLSQVGKERLDEMADPELAFERMIRTYKQKGYSDAWIQQRLRSIDIRKELTDEWQRSGIEGGKEFAILTNVMTLAWSGKSVRQYKEHKGLHKENLRDNMTNIELSLNQLAEVSTTMLSKANNPKGLDESKIIATEGGSIAGNARKELEEKLGRSIISRSNANNPLSLDEQDNTN